MSELKRFRGAFLAIGAALLAGGIYVATKPPPPETQDVTLKSHIERVHQDSRGTYGSPRVWERTKQYLAR